VPGLFGPPGTLNAYGIALSDVFFGRNVRDPKYNETISGARNGGAKGDAIKRTDANITATFATLSLTSTRFVSTDVGKTVLVDGAGVAGTPC
jgi:hypothetical protein